MTAPGRPPALRQLGSGGGMTRRQVVTAAGALAAWGALAAAPRPLDRLLGADAAAAGAAAGPSPAALRTFERAVEAVCSFDGRTPPPRRVGGRRQPTAKDAAARFDREYRAQVPGFRQGVDLLLPLLEDAPRTPPPFGAVSDADLRAYRGRPFSELRISLRLRLLRSWQHDRSRTPLDPGLAELTGIPDFGTLHRGAAYALTQLTVLSYYFDHRTWRPVGWGGPWLGRSHEREELPFSHHGHERYVVRFGGGVTG